MKPGVNPIVMLVHGAWHRPDCWDAVTAILKKKKIPVIAPAINPLHHTNKTGLSPETQTLLTLIRVNHFNHIILAGHSYGGTIIAELAGQIPQRIDHLVFLNAFVPVTGKSIMDDLPRFHRKVLHDLAKTSGDGTLRLPFAVWRDTFMNGADIGLIKTTYQQLVPERLDRFTRVSTAPPVADLKIPKIYVHAEDDIALPPGKWGWLPRMPDRLGHHRLIRIAGNHEVFFTAPGVIAGTILELVEAVPAVNC